MPIQISEPQPVGVVLPRQYTEVQTKAAWEDDWKTQKYIEPLQAAARLVPSMVRAEMRYVYGKQMREDGAALAWETPIDLTGQFCRIRTFSEMGSVDHFFGVFVDDATAAQGVKKAGPDTDKPTGDQMPVAFDLTHLVDRVEIDKTVFRGTSSNKTIDRLVPYNYRNAASGGIQGNRTENRHTYAGKEVYLHTEDTLYDQAWNNLDIVENLLAVYNSQLPFDLELAGQFSALGGIVDIFDPNGKSLLDCLNLLINRRYGLGWWLEVTGTRVKINVFSNTGEAVDLGDVQIPANANQVALVIDDAVDVLKARTTKNTSRKFERVIAEGDFVKVQATWQKTAGSLEDAWNVLIATAYEDEDGEDAEGKDRNRRAEKYRRVFQTYRVPDNWDGETLNGQPAMVAVSEKGEVTLENSTEADPLYRPGKRFLRYLLTEEENADSHAERGQPFALIRNEDKSTAEADVFENAESVKTDQCNGFHVRLLDTDMAVELRGTINHLLAKGDWTPADGETEIEPAFNNYTLHLTAAYEADSRIKYTAEVQNLAADEGETLRLRFPAAQAWVVAEDTVKGLEAGALVHWTAEADGGGSNLIRNDLPYLEARAKAALAWYEQDRSLLDLSYSGIAYPYALGSYIVSATHGNQAEPVGTVLSSITWDFQQGTTTIQTGWFELDFGRGGDPGMDDPKTVRNDLDQLKEAARKQTEHTQNLPVRITPVPF